MLGGVDDGVGRGGGWGSKGLEEWKWSCCGGGRDERGCEIGRHREKRRKLIRK